MPCFWKLCRHVGLGILQCLSPELGCHWVESHWWCELGVSWNSSAEMGALSPWGAQLVLQPEEPSSSAAPCCCIERKQAADEHVAVLVDMGRNNGTSPTSLNSPDAVRGLTHHASTWFSQDSHLEGAFRCTGWTITASKKSSFCCDVETPWNDFSMLHFQLPTHISHWQWPLKHCHGPFQLARDAQTAELLAGIPAFSKAFHITRSPSPVNLQTRVQNGLREGYSSSDWLKVVTDCTKHNP